MDVANFMRPQNVRLFNYQSHTSYFVHVTLATSFGSENGFNTSNLCISEASDIRNYQHSGEGNKKIHENKNTVQIFVHVLNTRNATGN
jgi:hypothetical protein